ncbi:LysE family translocator [Microbulbifer pacificus]|uniref:LysE family translocator n=1 Tax=Microbulbifer pacificus TaxID=407164 RepID=A0AAU0MUF5_9GAMM|nr:LysE family translocator [Microbulbifer pacificus]WOX04219.1 LysE family translocator [Microbulbifer pacificus]
MDMLSWLTLAGICALGAMSPGPSLLIVLRCAAAGPRQGLACAVAHGGAVALYACLTAFGLAVLVTHIPMLFAILQWGGAAMLVYLGWKALRAPAPSNAATNNPTPEFVSTSRAALQGFGIAFFNPKVAVFFTALFSQFVSAEQMLGTKLGMAGLAAGIDAIWYSLVALLVTLGSGRGWLSANAAHRLQQVFGVLLLGLAARLVFSIQ